MRTALAEIKEELGPDAIIMSSKKVSGGIEIVAALDAKGNGSQNSDDENINADISVKNMSSKSQKENQGDKNMTKESKQEKFADSLAALLARQQKTSLNESKPQDFMPKKIGEKQDFMKPSRMSPNQKLNLWSKVFQKKLLMIYQKKLKRLENFFNINYQGL